MKKETVIWILIAVLFMGLSVLFTLHLTSKCNYKSKYRKNKSYSQHEYKNKHHLSKIYQDLCESCQIKLKKKHHRVHDQ